MKWRVPVTWLSLLTILMNLVEKGGCLSCFRCNSVDGSESDCEDDFGTYNLKGHLLDRDCRVGVLEFESFYCVKIKGTNKLTKEKVVIRMCSSENWGTQCGDIILQQGNEEEPPPEEIDGCVASCNMDGCNGSTTVQVDLTIITGMLLAIFEWL